MSDVLFVLGMHRSGTSALARVLSLCGAELPPDLIGPSHDNPKGFWEPRRAVNANEAFLAANGSSIYDPSLALETIGVDPAAREAFRSDLVEFFRGFYTPGPVLVKDPRICVLLSDWKAAARLAGHAVRAILIFRDQYEVARSLASRQNMHPAKFLPVWIDYNLLAERDSRDMRRVFITYDDLLADWHRVVKRCNGALGLGLDVGAGRRPAIDEFLEPSQRHHVSNGFEMLGHPVVEQHARTVRALLERARAGFADTTAFDCELRSLLVQAPAMAEETSRESWRCAATTEAVLKMAEGAASVLGRRVAELTKRRRRPGAGG